MVKEVQRFTGSFLKDVSGVGLYRRSVDPIKTKIAQEPQEGMPPVEGMFGPMNTTYESWKYLKQQELSMTKTTAGLGSFLHLAMPLFTNVVLEGLNNNIASRSPKEKLAYMGKYFGAAIIDLGKLYLIPLTGGLSVLGGTIAEHVITSGVIAARQNRRQQ